MSEDTPTYGKKEQDSDAPAPPASQLEEELRRLRHDMANIKHGFSGVTELFDRVDELEKPVQHILPDWITDRLDRLEEAVSALVDHAACDHEPFSVDGRTPFYIMAIADEREVAVLLPGQRPEPTFAIGLCGKCWQTYVAVDRMSATESRPPAKHRMWPPAKHRM